RRFRQQVVTGTRAARASAAVDNGRSVTDGFANDGPASRTARLPHTSVASEFQQDVHTRDQLMAGLAATKTRPDSFLDVSY
ncbi:MAG: hypothetical protein P8K08_18785, partial [Fuerstiella sp.]|nr:hypothetical protein [Fuerstiella sp.]